MGKIKEMNRIMARRLAFAVNLIKAREFGAVIKRIKNLIVKKEKKIYDVSPRKQDSYDFKNKGKIAVYTCVTGGYDSVFSPLIREDCCDYFLFTDDLNIHYDKEIW